MSISLEDALAGDFVHEGMNRRYLFTRGRLSDALAVAIHPFGGSAERTYSYEAAPLLARGISVLVPEGYRNSWNAGACCGEAKQRKLNDAEFVRRLTQFILKEHFGTSTSTSSGGGGVKVYIAGYSNGAFLASQMALMQPSNPQQHWISAISMRSGYTYDTQLWSNAESALPSGLPVMALHGAEDDMVNPEGCCSTTRPCCCGITAETCVAFDYTLDVWKRVNKCGKSSRNSRRVEVASVGFSNVSEPGMQCELLDAECGVTSCWFPEQGHRIKLLESDELTARFVADFFWRDYSVRPLTRRITLNGLLTANSSSSSVWLTQQSTSSPVASAPHASTVASQDVKDILWIAFAAALVLLLLSGWAKLVTKGRALALAFAAARRAGRTSGGSSSVVGRTAYAKVAQREEEEEEDLEGGDGDASEEETVDDEDDGQRRTA